jgi:hypothetical protein
MNKSRTNSYCTQQEINNRHYCFAITLLFFLITFTETSAQYVEPRGKFTSDSIKIGLPVQYSLSVWHQAKNQILFPDTAYNYYPFELVSKEFFPTKTINGKSFDSAVYLLRTFGLIPQQQLALPVFVIHEGDSVSQFTVPDTIYLKEYLPEVPVNASMKEQIDFNKIPDKINYPYILTYIVLFLLIGSILYFFLGKAIGRRYKLYVVRSDHNSFLKNFQKLHNQFSSSKKTMDIEQALSMWKAYLARLESKPINTYTTTEIINLYNEQELKESLQVIDRAIYGGLISNEAEKAIVVLRRFSIRKYHKRKREIQHV